MKWITIYQYGDPKYGEAALSPKPPKRRFRFIGQAFIFAGLLGLFLTFGPFLFLEGKYRTIQITKPSPKPSFAELVKTTNEQSLKPVDTDFSLVIPKIGVNSRILPNISPFDEGQYRQALKIGVAQAAGTYLPGEGGTIFIFGHSTDFLWNVPKFNAVFYLLKEVAKGDEIDIFYQGRRYIYKVTDKVIVSSSQTSYLKPRGEGEELILQTCHPPGTTWERLLVFAKPTNVL